MSTRNASQYPGLSTKGSEPCVLWCVLCESRPFSSTCGVKCHFHFCRWRIQCASNTPVQGGEKCCVVPQSKSVFAKLLGSCSSETAQCHASFLSSERTKRARMLTSLSRVIYVFQEHLRIFHCPYTHGTQFMKTMTPSVKHEYAARMRSRNQMFQSMPSIDRRE